VEATKSAAKTETLSGESFTPTTEIRNLWESIYGQLRTEFGEAVFRSWLKPLSLKA
jgi:chromosomal replication initiator protein